MSEEEFSTEDILYKTYCYIFATQDMTNADFKKVITRQEIECDPYAFESAKIKLINAGALWLRFTKDEDEDVIIEGWKPFISYGQ